MSSEKMTLEETSDATGVETQETLTEDQLLLLGVSWLFFFDDHND